MFNCSIGHKKEEADRGRGGRGNAAFDSKRNNWIKIYHAYYSREDRKLSIEGLIKPHGTMGFICTLDWFVLFYTLCKEAAKFFHSNFQCKKRRYL